MRNFILSTLYALGLFLIMSRCGASKPLEEKNAKSVPAANPSCPVVASARSVNTGSMVELMVRDGFDWSKASLITLDGSLILTKTTPRVTVVAKKTKQYIAVTTKTDGSSSSCAVEILVPDAPAADVACTIAALPTAVPVGGGTVTITLQVVGASGADAATINGQTIDKVGGATTFNVSAATSFVGKVTKGEESATCVVDVGVAATVAPVVGGACKLQPDSTDLAALAAKQTELEATNAELRQAAIDAALKAEGGLTLHPEIVVRALAANELSVEAVCAAIAATNASPSSCTLVDAAAVDGRDRVVVETDQGKLVAIVVHGTVLAATTATGEPRVLRLNATTTPIGVSFDQCVCDQAVAGSVKDSMADAGMPAPMPPPISVMLFPVNADPSAAAWNVPVDYSRQVYTFDYRQVEPPAGTPRPKCEIMPEAVT